MGKVARDSFPSVRKGDHHGKKLKGREIGKGIVSNWLADMH